MGKQVLKKFQPNSQRKLISSVIFNQFQLVVRKRVARDNLFVCDTSQNLRIRSSFYIYCSHYPLPDKTREEGGQLLLSVDIQITCFE